VPKQNKVNAVDSTITGKFIQELKPPENKWLIGIYWEFTGNLPVNLPGILIIFFRENYLIPGISR